MERVIKFFLGSVLLPDMDVVITSEALLLLLSAGATLNLINLVSDSSVGSFFIDAGSNIVADVRHLLTLQFLVQASHVLVFHSLIQMVCYTLEEITPAGGDTVTINMTTNNGSLLRVEVVTQPHLFLRMLQVSIFLEFIVLLLMVQFQHQIHLN